MSEFFFLLLSGMGVSVCPYTDGVFGGCLYVALRLANKLAFHSAMCHAMNRRLSPSILR